MLYLAAVFIVFMLSTLTVIVRRGMNQIIAGLESIDERLAGLEWEAATRRTREPPPSP
jgi:hypothetical protein